MLGVNEEWIRSMGDEGLGKRGEGVNTCRASLQWLSAFFDRGFLFFARIQKKR